MLARRVTGSGTAAFVGLTYLGVLISLGSGVVSVRILGADGRGALAAVSTALLFIGTLCGAGLPVAFKRQVALDPDAAGRFRIAAERYALLSVAVTAPIGAFAAMGLFPADQPGPRLAAAVVLGLGGPAIIGTFYDQFIVAAGAVRNLAVYRFAPNAVGSVATVLLAAVGRLDLAMALALLLLTPVAQLLLARWFVPPRRGPAASIRPHAAFGVQSVMGQLAELATARLDQLLLLPLVGRADLGRYAVGVTIATLPIAVAQSMITRWFSDTARRSQLSAPAALALVGRTAAVTAAVCLVVGAIAPLVLPVLYGKDFEGLATTTWLLLGSSVVLTGSYAASNVLVARGQPLASSAGWMVSTITTVVTLPPAAARWGIDGAAGVSVLAYLAALLVMIGATVSGRWDRAEPAVATSGEG